MSNTKTAVLRLALLVGAVAILGGAAVAAGPALAARGGVHGGAQTVPTITLNETDPHLGGTVSFRVAYPGSVKSPRVQVMCSQGGVLVYGEAGSADHVFLLGGGSSDWLRSGGAADCTADLFYIVWNGNSQQQVTFLASTSFAAGG